MQFNGLPLGHLSNTNDIDNLYTVYTLHAYIKKYPSCSGKGYVMGYPTLAVVHGLNALATVECQSFTL